MKKSKKVRRNGRLIVAMKSWSKKKHSIVLPVEQYNYIFHWMVMLQAFHNILYRTKAVLPIMLFGIVINWCVKVPLVAQGKIT